jgi:hypothetical protein
LTKPEPSKFFALFLVAVSVFGLALIPFLLIQSNLQADLFSFRSPLVGVLYGIVCVLGIVAVFYPRKCRLMFQKPTSSSSSSKASTSEVQFSGHHPNCEKFSANRVTISGRVYCAACSGLLIGAIIALIGILMFSLGFLDLGLGSFWVLVTGEVLMFAGLTQIKVGGYTKMTVNALFVVGSCICLVTTDLIGQSLLLDVYVLGLIIYTLWVRISLSEWNNKRICLKCGHCV